jgi:hypothetical protein
MEKGEVHANMHTILALMHYAIAHGTVLHPEVYGATGRLVKAARCSPEPPVHPRTATGARGDYA